MPRLAWSSASPFNLRPRLLTLFYLNLGLVLFGLGESLLIASGAGVSPWTVLAQGIAQHTDWSIGFTTMVVKPILQSVCCAMPWASTVHGLTPAPLAINRDSPSPNKTSPRFR